MKLLQLEVVTLNLSNFTMPEWKNYMKNGQNSGRKVALEQMWEKALGKKEKLTTDNEVWPVAE